ncbi:MAG TPA: hypothetical protein VF624_05895 [Tepidisphaeraceae bacterium]
MLALIDAVYFLTLATWFAAALGSAIIPPVILRTIREADPTLPRVLSVNLDRQHATLLGGTVVSEIVQIMFRLEAVCALVFLPALIAKWFFVDRTFPLLVQPLIVTAIYIAATAFLLYGWRVVWPKAVRHRAAYIEVADDVDKANAELDLFDRYNHEVDAVVRNMVFIVMGLLLFSTALMQRAVVL